VCRVSGGIDPLNVNVGIIWRSASSHGSFYPTEITCCIDCIWHWLGPSAGLHDCLCRNSNPGSCQPVVFELLISVEPLWLNVTVTNRGILLQSKCNVWWQKNRWNFHSGFMQSKKSVGLYTDIQAIQAIQAIHKTMVRFQKLTRNLFLTLHGHNVHRQERQLSKFLMRYQQFACHAYCGAAGPVSHALITIL